ncbi:MAG: hypothetical protein HC935_11145 [Pseudanabaena sp. SU_2_4]|nr:hypothetical protein [Pseudanabaena sp. SU_2_4]
MTIAQIQASIEYVTNAAGEKINVLVPVGIWDKLIKSLQSIANDLDRVDEEEPKAQILDDLRESIRQAAGQTFPISELWDDIDV